MSLALAGGLSSTEPPGNPRVVIFYRESVAVIVP